MLPAEAGARGADQHEAAAGLIDLATRGNPIFAAVTGTPFDGSTPTAEIYEARLATLPEGLSYGAFHLAVPGDIDAMTPDAPLRTGEYALARGGAFGRLLDRLGIATTGMRGFREAMRSR
jgi:hypothetical protein